MDIKTKYYEVARLVTGRRGDVISLGAGSSMKDLIKVLSDRYGEPFSGYLLGMDGEPVDHLTYFVEGINIHSLRSFDTELKNGDTVVIAPTIVGG